jgi:hypothetical protein
MMARRDIDRTRPPGEPPVWSVPVRLDDVPDAGLHVTLTADPAIRPALARAAGVEDVSRVQADFDVVRQGRDGLRVTGTVSATVRQTCVVTLEPVENKVEEVVDLAFAPGAGAEAPSRDDEMAVEDVPEPLINGSVDLGAIAAEFLVLGIDPYPRRPDAVFTAPESGDSGERPFAALAALKKRP